MGRVSGITLVERRHPGGACFGAVLVVDVGVGRPGSQQCATDECRTDGRSNYSLHSSAFSFVVPVCGKPDWLPVSSWATMAPRRRSATTPAPLSAGIVLGGLEVRLVAIGQVVCGRICRRRPDWGGSPVTRTGRPECSWPEPTPLFRSSAQVFEDPRSPGCLGRSSGS